MTKHRVEALIETLEQMVTPPLPRRKPKPTKRSKRRAVKQARKANR